LQRFLAVSRATNTRNPSRLGWVTEAYRQLLTGANHPSAVEKQAPSAALPCQIGIATVVDKLRSAPAHTSVNQAISAKPQKIILMGRLEQVALVQAQAPARVFDHPLPGRDIFEREYAKPMNPGPANPEPVGRGFMADPAG